MKKDVFEEKIKPILTYIGVIGAGLTSIAYIILVVVLIKGFQFRQPTQTIVFAVANAAVGMIVASFLKYQGVSFAKGLPENQSVIEDYYKNRTRDKKNHSIQWFWFVTTIKDVLFKGVTIAASTLGLVYIVIVGSNDWSLMLMAIVNLVLFVCFGLLALNQAYEYYNNVYVNYMREQLTRAKDGYVKNDITEVINDDNGGRQAVKELAGTGREE